jgi:hypothetical protein
LRVAVVVVLIAAPFLVEMPELVVEVLDLQTH